MKILITGSRDASFGMLELVDQIVLDAKADGDEIIVGDADGVDSRVIYQCDLLRVPVTVYGAYGRLRRMAKTGFNYALKGNYPDRDRYMAEKAQECIAVWNGTSKGTAITFNAAKLLGVPVTVYDCSGPLPRKIRYNEVTHARGNSAIHQGLHREERLPADADRDRDAVRHREVQRVVPPERATHGGQARLEQQQGADDQGTVSGRSSAQRSALERDGWRCQWCLRVLGRIRSATDAHHVFRPRSLYDEPAYILSLCHECHLGLRHISGRLTDADLIQLVLIPYIWNGKDLTPHGH